MNQEKQDSAFGIWFDKNQDIIGEGIDLYKLQLQRDRGLYRLLLIGVSAFLFSLIAANEVFQEAYPTLLSIKVETISPNSYNVITSAYLALLILVSTSKRFSQYAKLVRFGLDWACYFGAVMFGLLFGEVAHILAVSSELTEINRGIVLLLFLLFQIVFMLSLLHFFARSMDAESVNSGFMSKWWAASLIIRLGFSLAVLMLTGAAMMFRSITW